MSTRVSAEAIRRQVQRLVGVEPSAVIVRPPRGVRVFAVLIMRFDDGRDAKLWLSEGSLEDAMEDFTANVLERALVALGFAPRAAAAGGTVVQLQRRSA